MTTPAELARQEIMRRCDAYQTMLAALNAIIDRSNNGELGSSKVNDMRRIAEDAIKEVA